MSKILLKRAILKDFQEIANLERLANSKTYAARLRDEEIRDFIKNESVFLIKKEKATIGLIAYEVLKGKKAHFNGLIINPKFRGQGFAKEAMVLILKKMPKYSRVELVVHPHNNSALGLYLSLGFIIESWKDNHFGDGEPRLMLAKNKC